ncbi:hypothetical protein DFR28_103175 [Arenicella xantha]|uniref:Uncharacterized protein n=1 Tax=Arenicella xantha TaxID=644221 RepID=A0A395JHY1_9GAMM|nr:hypothetical protein DFR28_103175 [Arenicella xantha]
MALRLLESSNTRVGVEPAMEASNLIEENR